MVKNTSVKIADELLYKNIIEEKDKTKFIFGLEVIITTTIQMLLFISLGLILNCLREIVLFSIGFCPIRIVSGGYHSNTFIKCIISSTIIILIGIIIALKLNNFNNSYIYI